MQRYWLKLLILIQLLIDFLDPYDTCISFNLYVSSSMRNALGLLLLAYVMQRII